VSQFTPLVMPTTTLDSPVSEENVDGAEDNEDESDDDEASEWLLFSSIDEIVILWITMTYMSVEMRLRLRTSMLGLLSADECQTSA